MTGEDRARRRGERRIAAAFGGAALAAAGFAVAYAAGAGAQLLGGTLALAFALLGYGLGSWAKRLLPSGDAVEEHETFGSTPRERIALRPVAYPPDSPLTRRGLARLLGLAAGAIGVAALFPLRSLLPLRLPGPAAELSRTAWRAGGLRLVTAEGAPVRLDDVTDLALTVLPEGYVADVPGDVPAFVVRLDPARFVVPPPAGHVRGVVAYSLLCTHAGCPVGLYEPGAARVYCPCHQSTFDLLEGARPISGPAVRPLPGLPIVVGADGFLRATGDFTGPPGPGFWSRP